MHFRPWPNAQDYFSPRIETTHQMNATAVLNEMFGRAPILARDAVDGLDPRQLASRPDRAANSIAWLVWHAARQQDYQLAEVSDLEQVWLAGGWMLRFGLALPADDNMGLNHTPEEVEIVQVQEPALLTGYIDAVNCQTTRYVEGLVESDLDAIVDTSYDPAVTLGVRLVSLADDTSQHLGQAAYLRGLLIRNS